jgi:hypothetical protein
LTGSVRLNIFYPPRVVARSTNPGPLIEGTTAAVTLLCEVESNPPAVVTWRRVGAGQQAAAAVSNGPSLTIQPVRREAGGSYQCLAENELGLSHPATVQLDIQCKYSISVWEILIQYRLLRH